MFALLSCVSLVGFVATAGCSEDTSPAVIGGDASVDARGSDDGATRGDSSAANDTGTTKGDAGTPSVTCVSTSDCRAYASSCGTCSCIPLSKDSVDPVCTSDPVNCIVDPCRDKSVGCVGGFCVIE